MADGGTLLDWQRERVAAVATGLLQGGPEREPISAAGCLTFGLATDIDALAALAADWNDLFDRAGQPHHVFQSHAFASAWAAVYAAPDSGSRLAIVTVRSAGRLVMLWPLVRSREKGCTTLSWLGDPVAQYGDVLADDLPDRLPVLEASWDWISRQLAPDVVRLRKVREDATAAPLLAGLAAVRSDVTRAPVVRLAAAGTRASFECAQPAKAKKNRRRLLRRLEEKGRVEFKVRRCGGGAQAAVAAALAMKRAWIDARGLVARAFVDDRLDRFFAVAAGPAGAATGCTAFTLDLDGAPVAAAVGFRARNRLTLHLITYSLEHEKAGAGVLNLEAVLRHAEAEGLDAVDLLAPLADYKSDWTDESVEVADHAVALTARGRVLAGAWDGLLRPHLKLAIERLPPHLRGRIARRIAALA